METLGSPVVDPTLLPDLAGWLAVNPSETFDEYAHSAIQLDHFFVVGSLLWPNLVRHRGGLFLEGFNVNRFNQWFTQSSSLTAVERVMNHRHMRDMLRSLDDAPRAVLVSAATLMQQCWEARLKQLSPDVPTKVEMYQTEHDVEITFYTIRTDKMNGGSG